MRRIPGALVVAVALTVSAGCGAVGSGGSGPQVVASFYPLAYVAERVAGDHIEVDNLTSPGVEPHDLEMTPQQVADLSEADLVVYEQGFQPAVDEAVDQNSPDLILDVTEVVELGDPGAERTASEDERDYVELEGDPHVWLDPTLLIPVAHEVASELAEIDPDHAADFRANANRLVSDLERLDSDFTDGLSQCERSTFVTSHAAFGYLAHRYGLEMVPIAGLSPDAEPSPQQLSQISDLIEAEGITTVFSETLGSQEYADTLANDLGVQTAVLDPIEGLTDEDSSDDYLSLMRENLTALREANGCA
ncbi:MAG: metal ABC transporter substrate-binding protein [Nocardioidaceae bacterium]